MATRNDITEACRDHRQGPVDAVLADEQRRLMTAALDGLADVELQIVTMRFGLAGHRPRSITFVAKILKMPQERAETLLAESLEKMREAMG